MRKYYEIKKLFIPILTGTIAITPVLAITSCNENVAMKSLTVHATEKTIKSTDTLQMYILPEPSNTTNQDVTWSIDTGSEYADIDQTGKLTPKQGSSGHNVTIKATAKQNSEISERREITIDDTATSESITEYVYNRTFSLRVGAKDSISSEMTYGPNGTCWILADATTGDSTDYVYYIATNWHVKHHLSTTAEEYKKSIEPPFTDIGMYFADVKGRGVELTDYTYFGANNFEFVDDSNFTYGGEMFQGKTAIIDLHVAKVNFENAPDKTKLNKLNQLTAAGKKITEISKTASDEYHPLPKEMATCGFPVVDEQVIWQENKFNPYDESTSKINYYKKYEIWHVEEEGIKLPTDLILCSPMFRMDSKQSIKCMPGGASGSMLAGKMDGEFAVYGIYWGGFTDEDQATWRQLCFCIFNTTEKNFLKPWVPEE